MVSGEGEAAFTVDAIADGESKPTELFSGSSGSRREIHIPLAALTNGFYKIRLIARGRGARWENVSMSNHMHGYPTFSEGGVPIVKPPQSEIPPVGADSGRGCFSGGHGRCNVIIFLVDALRADRLGCYGYDKPTSPHIDEFARASELFRRAYAPASWTRASVASLFTGLGSPRSGGVGRNDFLRHDIPTLAEALSKAGYYTIGFVSNGNIASELGFGRGFNRYIYLPEKLDRIDIYPSSQEILEAAMPQLEAAPEPFFAYIHVIDPHAPYAPAPEFATKFIPNGAKPTAGTMDALKRFIWRNPPAYDSEVAFISGLYDGEVATTDKWFGGFLEWLDRRSLADHTVVIFTADHGEEFYDHHGLGHGGTLYNELLRIPLIIRYPGVTPRGNDSLASLSDIMPTILALTGASPDISLQGIDLRLLDNGGNLSRPIYSYERLDKVEKESIIVWPYKLIHNINKTNQWGETVLEYELYNIETDPGERTSLLNQKPITRRALLDMLKEARHKNAPEIKPPPPAAIPPDLKKRLQAIGY